MWGNGVRIRARIDFLSAADGGRSTPLDGGTPYRPNHNLFGQHDRDMALGEIQIPPGQTLQPGESIETELTLYAGAFAGEIVRGRRWRIQEGAKLVAIGTILDVLPPTP